MISVGEFTESRNQERFTFGSVGKLTESLTQGESCIAFRLLERMAVSCAGRTRIHHLLLISKEV